MNGMDLTITKTAALSAEAEALTALNDVTARYGLALTEGAALRLVRARGSVLMESGRVGFGSGLIKKLILAFCDSDYLVKEDYEETLASLLEAFYYIKNESGEALTDDEALCFMRERFDESGGSVEPILSALPGELNPRRLFSEEYDAEK